jgi:hypothetical protein
VLKLNMYDLEGGERSVFEQELRRESAAKQGWAARTRCQLPFCLSRCRARCCLCLRADSALHSFSLTYPLQAARAPRAPAAASPRPPGWRWPTLGSV